MTDDAHADLVARVRARVGLTLKGKWRIDQLIGVGGMASVYAATHRNNKRVAVKMLHPELSMNVAVRQRFLREGYVANSVGHAGAVSVDDDDVTDDGCAFLVMELLEGETLDARWERKGRRFEATEVLAVMDQVLDTLVAAHEKGIVHRDLKPENLFLTYAGHVKVLDFGIARVRELSAGASSTQTGSLMGTPTFMPPEQARGLWAEVDGASDIWALGATMFTLLTGRYVHVSRTVNEALVLAVTQPAPSVGSVGVALPVEVVELVDTALAYEKSQRWPDARAMQEALRHVYEALTTKPISLLDAIAEDAPVGSSRPGAAVSLPRTPTTADGVSATMLSGGSRNRLPLPRLRLLALGGVALLVVLVAIAGGLRRHAAAEGHAEPSAEQAALSAPPVATPTLPSLPAVEPAVAEQLVVPVERLPLASATPLGALPRDLPKKDLVRSPATPQPVSLAESARPAAAAVPKGAAIGARSIDDSDPYAAAPADPYSTRH
jgi:serine/threonine protein kinase